MSALEKELAWEKHMVDLGLAKYNEAIQLAKYRKTDKGTVLSKAESSTSYGVSLIREYFEKFEVYINEFVDTSYLKRGTTNIAAQYISLCDSKTVAYLAARCIIDTISVRERQTALAFRIGGRLEDQMRLIQFSDDYGRYYDSLIEDMEDRGVINYRRKRRTLVHCHDKALVNAGKPEWIRWPDDHRLQIGLHLIDLFMAATGLIDRVSVWEGARSNYYIVGTDDAFEIIKANQEVFQFLHPEYLPTLMPPKDWTTPFDGGYWSEQLRERRPLVKIRGYSRKAHKKALINADMPKVYAAINAAQQTAWTINKFVLEQAAHEAKAFGIGFPEECASTPPESPYPLPDKGSMTNAEFAAFIGERKALMTEEQRQELKEWRSMMRNWHKTNSSAKAKALGLFNVVRIARLMAEHKEFFYVYTMDSRGRLYPSGSHLSPQGVDLSKGLLQFANGTPLGKFGYWHMCIHAAGMFDVGKVSIKDRVSWIHEHAQLILDTWQNPADTREFWGSADKPYMFLAACKELAEVWMSNGQKILTIVDKQGLKWYAKDYESHLSGNQDGSCNGIQHFGAMLKDTVTSKSVNLNASDEEGSVQNDLYGQTAARAAEMMTSDLSEGLCLKGLTKEPINEFEIRYMTDWLNSLKIDRKVCKRSTMIIPYGGQKSSCLEDVQAVLADRLDKMAKSGEFSGYTAKDQYRASYVLHHYIWSALDEVVVAARRGMNFLTQAAQAQSKTNIPMQWTSPIGFPCFQDYKSTKEFEVNTKISGRMVVTYLKETDDVNIYKMKNAFAPNFVHSMDATHLMMSVNMALDEGITDFALVHDSLGVPFGQCETFHKAIRKAFVELYTPNRLYLLKSELSERYQQISENLPTMGNVQPGDFDINEVLAATHFFR